MAQAPARGAVLLVGGVGCPGGKLELRPFVRRHGYQLCRAGRGLVDEVADPFGFTDTSGDPPYQLGFGTSGG